MFDSLFIPLSMQTNFQFVCTYANEMHEMRTEFFCVCNQFNHFKHFICSLKHPRTIESTCGQLRKLTFYAKIQVLKTQKRDTKNIYVYYYAKDIFFRITRWKGKKTMYLIHISTEQNVNDSLLLKINQLYWMINWINSNWCIHEKKSAWISFHNEFLITFMHVLSTLNTDWGFW